MNRKLLFSVRCISFLLLISILLYCLNTILTPKFLSSDSSEWQTSATYANFYEMEKNTIDVLFLGSSHAAAGFNPQVMYNNYGIKSYNLGCEQQNLLVSYYWLKEALKYQKPKVVVLDAFMAFPYNRYEALNTAEPYTRKALDSMHWSINKLEAIEAITNYDNNQDFYSYIFPNVRYHSRWTELEENDFTFKSMESNYYMKGYCPLNNKNDIEYRPFVIDDTIGEAEMVPLMRQYLDMMVRLCEDYGIKFLITKTPTTMRNNTSYYNSLKQYSDANDIDYLDFNNEQIFNEINFNFNEEMNDSGHANIWGAEKISLYLAAKLYYDYEIRGGEGSKGYEQWLLSNISYNNILEEAELRYIEDIDEYLDKINRDRYTILISGQRDISATLLDNNIKEYLKNLGLELKVNSKESYYAAIRENIIDEEASSLLLDFHGTTRGGLIDFEIVSTGLMVGDKVSSIKINDIERTNINYGDTGMKIVVYSNDSYKVIDSIFYNGSMIFR